MSSVSEAAQGWAPPVIWERAEAWAVDMAAVGETAEEAEEGLVVAATGSGCMTGTRRQS